MNQVAQGICEDAEIQKIVENYGDEQIHEEGQFQ
jgi:hypothetical protein